MSGSGLQSALEQVYAEDTVPHILSGKAVSRARRGYLLVACALEGLKISKMYDIDLDFEEEFEVEATNFTERFLENEELGQVVSLLDQSLSSSINNEQLGSEEVFNEEK